MKIALPVIFEDECVLVVHKPAGLLSVPDRFDAGLPHLRSLLEHRYGPLYLVHRLDRDTSGLLLLARNPEVQAHLSRQFEQRRVKKIYWALVEGRPGEDWGEIDKPLAPHPGKAGRMIVSSKGKDARSRYRLLEAFSMASLLEVELLTGRTHQIRVHLQAIGHPLLVDPVYGRRAAFRLSELKGRRYRPNRQGEERPLLARQSLHARQVRFQHPQGGQELLLEAELPKDMRAALKQLRKWASAG